MSGWSPGGYSNGPMMPNAVIITCSTGSFADGTSRSESFLREGTPTVPKGAVTAIGTATSSTHTMFNNCVSMGIFHGIFRENIFNMGGALVHGKLNLYNTYSTNSPNQTANFSNWNNLMGDPGMEVWTGIPEYLIVTNASEVVQGTNFIDVSVTNSSAAPVADAWVTVLGQTDDAVFATGYTDQNGNISLPLDTNYSGDYYLTVTAHDFVPYLMDIESVNADVFVNVSDFAIDDDTSGDSSGNDDGLLNPSEQIELSILLGNYGTNTATGVSATISCEQDFIDISDNTENYGDISAGNTESSSDDFDISVNEDVLGGTEFVLDITISSSNRTTWTDHLELTVDGANLMPDSYTVEDGNNDFPEPGETFELISELINAGSVAAENINGTLTCLDDDVTISDANGYFGNIAASGTGTNSGNTFEITTDATIIPGTLIPFEINLTNDSGYSNTVTFNVQIGEANISDPLGPDAYGYYIYDDEDTNYYNTPVYNWIEIDPDYGGPGTTLPLYDNGDTGDIDVIDLPFGFRMYGEQYSEITVCSNGWIAPGVTEDFSFMNWNIPGPGGPSPMIAVFWDDLKTSGGNVCYYNDTAMHKFIIEWSHMQSDYANDEETFQVILYDPNYYPTATGDSEILFQYKEINNTSQGNTDNYPMDHGQYCTIGLEDPTGIIGLEYTFNNMYPVQAKHLEDEMAILITGPPISFIQPYPVLGSLTIDDALNGNGNGNPDFGEGIFLGVGLNNLGETAATGLSGVISSTDEYITILNDVSDYPDIDSGASEQNITAYEIEIAGDCPNGHIASFTIDVTGDEAGWEWELYFQLELNAPSIFVDEIFINDGDNNILDPGETTDIQISFLNEGSAAVYNSGVELISDDANIILNSTTIDFGTFDEESVILGTFNVSVSEDAPLGYISNVTALLTGDFDYTSSHQFNLNVGTIAEDFETGGFENLPWEQSGSADWYIDDNAYEGNYCAKSGTITHNQVSQISIEMDVFTDGTIVFYRKVSSESNDYLRFFIDGALQGQWSGNVDWSEVSFPVTEGTRTFRWQYLKDGYGDSGQDCAWIDSIVFPPGIGFIAGMVLLSDGDGNVEDTVVTAGQYTTNPNESGEYLLQVPEGNYELTAVLANYEPITFYNVIVIANQTTSRFIPLAFMTPPTNLSANIVNDNDVELEWDYPTLRETAADHEDGVSKNTERNSSSRTSNRDSRSVTGFKIYRDEAEIAELEGTEITSYTDIELEEGEYEYFVTAVYTAGESEPTESVSIEVDANDSAGDLIPPFTALKGNFPNPFNPNTSIKFQLADAGDIELEIYNVKGQKVKTLFTGNMKAGYHIIDWNGKDNFGYSVSSGIYFYEMKTDNYSDIKKMIMLK